MPRPTVLVRESAFVSEVKEDEKGLFDLFGVVHTLKVLEQIRQVFIPAFKESNELHQAKITENYEFSFPVDEPSEPFEKPALILLGRQDSEVGYRDAWAFLENYPRATFAILDRAGHFLQLEQEELFRALVEEWLRRVEEFGGFEHKRGLEYLKTVVNPKK
jgi:pimeloyl-ACP methyl ester carboxylesterase